MILESTVEEVHTAVSELSNRARKQVSQLKTSIDAEIESHLGEGSVSLKLHEIVFGPQEGRNPHMTTIDVEEQEREAKQLRAYLRSMVADEVVDADISITMKLIQRVFVDKLVAPIAKQLATKIREHVVQELEESIVDLFTVEVEPLVNKVVNIEARSYSSAIASRIEYLYDVMRQNIRAAAMTPGSTPKIVTDEIPRGSALDVSQFMPVFSQRDTSSYSSEKGRVHRADSITVEHDDLDETMTFDEKARFSSALACHMSVEDEEATRARETADERLRRVTSTLRHNQKGNLQVPVVDEDGILQSSFASSPATHPLTGAVSPRPANLATSSRMASTVDLLMRRKESTLSGTSSLPVGRLLSPKHSSVSSSFNRAVLQTRVAKALYSSAMRSPSAAGLLEPQDPLKDTVVLPIGISPRLHSHGDGLMWMSAEECNNRIQREEELWQQNDQLRALLRHRYEEEENRLIERERQVRSGMYQEQTEHEAKYAKLLDQSLDLAGTVRGAGELAEMLLVQLEHARHYSRKLEAEVQRLRLIGAEAVLCRTQVRLDTLLREFEEHHVDISVRNGITIEMKDIATAEQCFQRLKVGYKVAADVMCETDDSVAQPPITTERLLATLQHGLPSPSVLEVEGYILEAACCVTEVERENQQLKVVLAETQRALASAQRKVISDVTSIRKEQRMQFEGLHRRFVTASKKVQEQKQFIYRLLIQIKEAHGGGASSMDAQMRGNVEERLQVIIADLQQRLDTKQRDIDDIIGTSMYEGNEQRRYTSPDPWWQVVGSRPGSARPTSASRWLATPAHPPTEPCIGISDPNEEGVYCNTGMDSRRGSTGYIPIRPTSARVYPAYPNKSILPQYTFEASPTEAQQSPPTVHSHPPEVRPRPVSAASRPQSATVVRPNTPKQYGNWRTSATYSPRANPSLQPTTKTASEKTIAARGSKTAKSSTSPKEEVSIPIAAPPKGRIHRGFTVDGRLKGDAPITNKKPIPPPQLPTSQSPDDTAAREHHERQLRAALSATRPSTSK